MGRFHLPEETFNILKIKCIEGCQKNWTLTCLWFQVFSCEKRWMHCSHFRQIGKSCFFHMLELLKQTTCEIQLCIYIQPWYLYTTVMITSSLYMPPLKSCCCWSCFKPLPGIQSKWVSKKPPPKNAVLNNLEQSCYQLNLKAWNSSFVSTVASIWKAT